MTPDLLAYRNLPSAAVIVLGVLTIALFAWLPQPQPAQTVCKPLYLPTATDGPDYSWQWPLQEQEPADDEATDDPPRRKHHRRRG